MEILFWAIIGIIGWSILKKVFHRANDSRSSAPISNYTQTMARHGLGKRRKSQRFISFEKPNITLSDQAVQVLDLFENTKDNIFLTGRAGTGKSTLLRYFRATTKKNIAVLAYTGVAAVNIQGQTIHSFFKFRPNITEEHVRKLNGGEADIYRKLDTVVIDEASMVRADFFDCIEKFLRLNGPEHDKPFGGIQIILIGDLYQLPPIVTENEKKIFETYYRSPFFFDAKCYKKTQFVKIELTHVYRQEDDKAFIEILDAVRVCSATDEHIKTINRRLESEGTNTTTDFQISLVTTNAIAYDINNVKLAQLPGQPKIYHGKIEGEFKEKNLPTDPELKLKEGAQVMLLNNDPKGRWINGDLVKILDLDDVAVRVIFKDNTFDDIGPYKWEMVRFVYDEEEEKIKSEIVGTFTQLPMKLAWAVTIHKGQGKTFERATIDFGHGTFASGQAYVALSRCKSLKGLRLKSPLENRHIFVDPRIDEFMKKRN